MEKSVALAISVIVTLLLATTLSFVDFSQLLPHAQAEARALPDVADSSAILCSGNVQNLWIEGTLQYLNIEGGCWVVLNDLGVSYEPCGALAAEIEQPENMGRRIRIFGRFRPDLVSVCMVGYVFEVFSYEFVGQVASPQPNPCATLVGDFDCDCDVDVADIMQVAGQWRSTVSDPGYVSPYDLDCDGDIDITDIMKVAMRWGRVCRLPLDYSPYRDDQAPWRPSPSPTEIAEDMEIISSHTNLIRTYGSCDELAPIPEMARQFGIDVLQGAELGPTPTANAEEIACLISAVQNNENISAAVGGGEVLLREDMPIEELVGYIEQARQTLCVPVATGESWYEWCNRQICCERREPLASAVDFILAHAHPYWEGQCIEHAAAHVVASYALLQATYPDKKVVMGEAGWPTEGELQGCAEPSLENQLRFIQELWGWHNRFHIPVLYFEAFDEGWKCQNGPEVECHWGLYYSDRTPKHPCLRSSPPCLPTPAPATPTPAVPTVEILHPPRATTIRTGDDCSIPIFGVAHNAGPGWRVRVEVRTDTWYHQCTVPIAGELWGVPKIYLSGQRDYNDHTIRATLLDGSDNEVAVDVIEGLERTNPCPVP